MKKNILTICLVLVAAIGCGEVIPRESWWTDTLLVLPPGSSDLKKARKIVLPGAKFYKARWF